MKHFVSLFLHNNPGTNIFCLTFQTVRPAALDAPLSCFLLHRDDSYFRLGPFKYEILNEVPHVGTFRDFASTDVMDKMKACASGKMMSTPYVSNAKTVIDGISFSKQRTSKVRSKAKFLNLI